jgi:hypothetical protein
MAGSAAAKPPTTLALTKQQEHHWLMDLDPGRLRPRLPVTVLEILAPVSILHLAHSLPSAGGIGCPRLLPLLSPTADYRHAATLVLTAPPSTPDVC